ncbi:MAG: hypothetical protein KIPDCIKN_03061 [Haliscomenobacter sp.]|jgi:CRISPR-associated protein Cmr2|nr:hypothetical protein [Haliscomenobacter sp.]
MTHLFLFTIGPVQSFIAQARKTRDLHAGSQLLSVLVQTAMGTFRDKGGKVVFPDAASSTQPNRFLGYLGNEDSSTLAELGKAVEGAVREKWKLIANEALGGMNAPAGYDDQIAQALEIFWVFHPATEDSYATDYRNTERSLGAIKNARPVSQYHYQKDENGRKVYGERGRKCSLDGERNVKFYRLGEKDKEREISKKLFVRDASEFALINHEDMKVIAPGEGLSAVSWVKRNYAKSNDFEPTAYFAAADFLSRVKKNSLLDQKLALFKSCFGNDWDEQLLFEENYTESYFKQQGINSHFNDHGAALDVLVKFYKTCKNQDIEKPNGYYALLLFDGDNMGQWLSGTNLANGTDGKTLLSFHRKLASCLMEYGKAAKQYLGFPRGKAVYAGGDDFLGFVTLDYVFPVLKELRRLFDEHINKPLFEGADAFQTKGRKRLTFSAGVVIAHYKTPLHVVLDWARSTEKSAKKYIHPDGQRKDMLALSVLKASGEINQAFVPFRIGGDVAMDQLSTITESLRDDFSDKWMRNLAQEFALLTNDNTGELELPYHNQQENRALLIAEIVRLLGRACKKHGDGKEKEVAKLRLSTEAILPKKATEGFRNFTTLLHICDFIQRQTVKCETDNSETTKETTHHG